MKFSLLEIGRPQIIGSFFNLLLKIIRMITIFGFGVTEIEPGANLVYII